MHPSLAARPQIVMPYWQSPYQHMAESAGGACVGLFQVTISHVEK